MLAKFPRVLLSTNKPYQKNHDSATLHRRQHNTGQLRFEALTAAVAGRRVQVESRWQGIPPQPAAAGRSVAMSAATTTEGARKTNSIADSPSTDKDESVYDAVVVGAGIGGIVAACQLAERGVKVLLLERYLIPGGSAGRFERDGYIFDVGASVMFGLGTEVSVGVITRENGSLGIGCSSATSGNTACECRNRSGRDGPGACVKGRNYF